MPSYKGCGAAGSKQCFITRGERAQFFRKEDHYALAFPHKCRHQPMVNKTIHEIAI
jgi:hypothetical protein